MISPATSELIFTCTTGCSLPLPVTSSVRLRRWAFSVTTVMGFCRLQPVPSKAAAIRTEVTASGKAGRESMEGMGSGSTTGAG